jgi:hypothetical protein
MTKLTIDSNSKPIQVASPGAAENVSISGTAATSGATTQTVCRLCSTEDCYYSLVGTATTASTFLPAFTVEFVRVEVGATISAITSSATGSLNITQMV